MVFTIGFWLAIYRNTQHIKQYYITTQMSYDVAMCFYIYIQQICRYYTVCACLPGLYVNDEVDPRNDLAHVKLNQ